MPTINIRVNEEQKAAIEAQAVSLGFDSVGAFIKFACINVKVDATMPSPNKPKSKPKPASKAKAVYNTPAVKEAVIAPDPFDSSDNVEDFYNL